MKLRVKLSRIAILKLHKDLLFFVVLDKNLTSENMIKGWNLTLTFKSCRMLNFAPVKAMQEMMEQPTLTHAITYDQPILYTVFSRRTEIAKI